jgi:Nif-specific regulatory protein
MFNFATAGFLQTHAAFMLAYLVIREGSKWTDVFRLIPGQPVTIGRAPTNNIVVQDDRCSRFHAELANINGEWIVRDLGSRNGTNVAEGPIKGEYVLEPGDVIRIGRSQLKFVYDLSKAFPESSNALKVAEEGQIGSDGASAADFEEQTIQEPTTIMHRRGQTKFFKLEEEDQSTIPKVGRAAAKLCRLAFELAKAQDVKSVAEQALAGVFEEVGVDTGAVLLLPRDFNKEPTGTELEIVASRSNTQHPYHQVSPFMASTVLREGEAVLARNILGDSTVSRRDSKGEIHASSVMCAPIRRGKRVFGLLHLYSTDAERSPDADDLEFTLAVADTAAVALHNLSRRQELAENLNTIRDENLQLRERLGVQSEIVGKSAVVAKITEEIARAASSKVTVLIHGESGVGKELVARAVHFTSPRKKGVFVCLNCAALTESLLESELFGHERGAFTGATERKIGKFEAAHSGTLMLDEIGEMSPTIQAKFLRVLEGHPFERVGGSEPVKVDVRVIAATNRDLEKDVAEGRFRRDLFFRLNVLQINVPALRKRPEDIPELCYYFLQKFISETGRKVRGFTPRAMDKLVRELRNVVERAIVLAEGEYIDVGDLMLSKLSTAGDTAELPPQPSQFTPISLDEMERRHIMATLNATGWNKSQTANILGIERSTLDRKIRRYQISEEGVRRR